MRKKADEREKVSRDTFQLKSAFNLTMRMKQARAYFQWW